MGGDAPIQVDVVTLIMMITTAYVARNMWEREREREFEKAHLSVFTGSIKPFYEVT